MRNCRIAVLGATGHIAQSLIQGLALRDDCELFLFARNTAKLEFILSLFPNLHTEQVQTPDFAKFGRLDYDVVINCIGIGNPDELIRDPYQVFRITEEYDNIVLSYLSSHCSTLYINFSSGAAYGTDFESPATDNKLSCFAVNHLSTQDFYGVAKLNAEAKHRSLKSYRITDLRIFGFFSPFIDLKSNYLLTDIIASVRSGKPLLTGPQDIVRDYVHPTDLDALIQLVIQQKDINTALDVYSLKPIRKFELLDYFSVYYGLRYQIHDQDNLNRKSATGSKENYYSADRTAERIGYKPIYSSLQSIADSYRQLAKNMT